MEVAPLRAAKSLESKLGTREKKKQHISLVEYALIEVKNPSCLVWHSNSEIQGNGRDDRDQRKRGRVKNRKANNNKRKTLEKYVYQTV